MKRTLTTILLSLAALMCAAQTTVVFPLKQMTGNAARRELVVTSLDGVRKVGTNLVYPVPMTVTAQGGQFRTNLLTGNYRLTMQGVPGYSDAFVPDTNVVVYWNDLVPATPSALTLSQYYTRAQIDALLAAIGGGGGDTLTFGNDPTWTWEEHVDGWAGLLMGGSSPKLQVTSDGAMVPIGNSLTVAGATDSSVVSMDGTTLQMTIPSGGILFTNMQSGGKVFFDAENNRIVTYHVNLSQLSLNLTNQFAPGDAETPAAWVNVTVAGQAFKLPVYK